MAYRETDKTKTKKAAVRQQIVIATHALVSQQGFRETAVSAIAQQANIAVGTVYRHFPSKSQLFSEVFRNATEKEVHNIYEAVNSEASVTERLVTSIESFSRRALKAPRLAWSLIAEPVDPLVEADRLAYRHAYAELFEQLLEEGARSGEWPSQSKSVNAAALVGAMAEALIGPLAPQPARIQSNKTNDRSTENTQSSPQSLDADKLIKSIVQFCVQAVTGKEYNL